jgi:serine/threonine protein kinase
VIDLLTRIEQLPRSECRASEGEDVPGLEIPSQMRIGRYEVFEILGAGAFGFVLKAFDPVFRFECALKIPTPLVLLDPKRRRQFLAEARKLHLLSHPAPHPNVVRVYDADECGEVCYFAMEICALGSLEDWLGKLPEGAVLPQFWVADLVRRIADGVQHAHDRGIYHRDIKPANILLSPFEQYTTTEHQGYEVSGDYPPFCPKVADFGLATILGDEPTVDGSLVGTRPYMAPEQIRRSLAPIGPATDVWALGVILYELLTRRRPFEGPGDAELFQQICEKAPQAPRVLHPDVPKRLQKVCLTCLEKHPADRYQSPSELANDLKRFLQDMDPLGRPVPPWIRVLRRARAIPVRAYLLALTATGMTTFTMNVIHQRKLLDERLLWELESAAVASLPELVPRLSQRRDALADRVGSFFDRGTDAQKLGAALVLLRGSDDRPYSEYCYNRLLDATPETIQPIASVMSDVLPELKDRLEANINVKSWTKLSDVERRDRRRANAGCALILLGLDSDESAWSLLRPAPEPQAKTFLIHLLGPAKVEPSFIVDRIIKGGDTSIKPALIQSLDQIPWEEWKTSGAETKGRASEWLLHHYRTDPDASVHASAKWLLSRWGFESRLREIDGELTGKPPAHHRSQWRISRVGLTLVTIDDPALDRVIEVGDSEITVALFREFDRTRPEEQRAISAPEISPTDTCPVNGISYYDAAAFCNWLNGREGLSDGDACYRLTGESAQPDGEPRQAIFKPLPDHLNRGGFRLPTAQEFVKLCAAGTVTRRYHGDSDDLFERYAWITTNSDGRAHPVASLIPNDFGLFDTLGNLEEWCDDRGRRGGWHSFSPYKSLNKDVGFPSVRGYWRYPIMGFRVVRTKGHRK